MELVTVGGEFKNRRLVWYVFKTFYCFSGWNGNSFFFFFDISDISHLFLNIHLNTWNYIHGCAVKEHQIKTFDITPSKIIECSQLLSNQHSIFRTACMENRMFQSTKIYCAGRAVCIQSTQYSLFMMLLEKIDCVNHTYRFTSALLVNLHSWLGQRKQLKHFKTTWDSPVLASGGNQTETLFSPPGGRIQ